MGTNIDGVKYFEQDIQLMGDLGLDGIFKNRIMTFGAAEKDITSSDYKLVYPILFPGTNTMIPTTIKLLANNSKTSPYSIKIFDSTNRNDIAEVTGLTNDALAIIDLGAISNLSTDEAIWELQAKIDTNGSRIFIAGLSIY